MRIFTAFISKALGCLPGVPLLLLCACAVTSGERSLPGNSTPRLALVIGNSAYSGVGALPNAANDARLIATTLRELGFEVTEVEDANAETMTTAIQAYGDDLYAAGGKTAGVFYYSGHGTQIDEQNYLLPVDVDTEKDVVSQGVALTTVLQAIKRAENQPNFVILDSMFSDISKPDPDYKGLTLFNVPPGALIAFATQPGETALDGPGEHGPYAAALAAAMLQPDTPAQQMFVEVRNAVIVETVQPGVLAQIPWEASALRREFYFAR